MKAMVLNNLVSLREENHPLRMEELEIPEPGEDEILIKVSTCGVCHTELDEIEGRTPPPRLPVILGHQVVGRVVRSGKAAVKYNFNERVGVAWIFSSCGKCHYCLGGNENLCPEFMATGRDRNGGYAEYMTVPEKFVHPIPEVFNDEQAAPLLCAGAIGYRSLRLAVPTPKPPPSGERGQGEGIPKRMGLDTLGLTGFGASAHLVMKMVRHKYPQTRVYVFARSPEERRFAIELGAVWAGDSADECPEKLDAIIDTTPVWKTVVEALKNLRPGGRLVINAIRKENNDRDYLLNIEYPVHLWMEKEIKSVANVAMNDVREFLQLASEIPIIPEIEVYPLEEANTALMELKQQKIRGAKVLKI